MKLTLHSERIEQRQYLRAATVHDRNVSARGAKLRNVEGQLYETG
jgi:hypothetical protein